MAASTADDRDRGRGQVMRLHRVEKRAAAQHDRRRRVLLEGHHDGARRTTWRPLLETRVQKVGRTVERGECPCKNRLEHGGGQLLGSDAVLAAAGEAGEQCATLGLALGYQSVHRGPAQQLLRVDGLDFDE